MSSNTDTINNLANSIKNNPTAQKYMSRLDQGRAKMLKFINENKQKVISRNQLCYNCLLLYIYSEGWLVSRLRLDIWRHI